MENEPEPTTINGRVKRKRWSASVIRNMADLAREKNVSIRLEPDGAIIISPMPGTTTGEDSGPHYSGLKDW